MHRTGSNKSDAPRGSGGLRSDWRTKAACRGYTDPYFDPWDADPGDGMNPTAESFCKTCPVKRDCLLAGFQNDRISGTAFGIWGGCSPKQRRAMSRLRYREGCPVCKGQLIITPAGEEWQACAACGITWRCRKREAMPGSAPPS